MLKVILFDFDGVIANTFDLAFKINEDLGSGLTAQQYRDLFNGNINDHYKEKNGGVEQKEGDSQFFNLYRPKLMKMHPVLGMDDVIKELAETHVLFIVSSTDSGIIKDFLQREELLDCFKGIYGNDVDYSKVKKIKIIQEKYKVRGDDCVFVTDTLGDILEAEKCGVKSIAVTWGYHSEDNLAKGNPVKTVNLPEEIIGAVDF